MKKKFFYFEQPNGAFLDILGFDTAADLHKLRALLEKDLECSFYDAVAGPYSAILPFVFENEEYTLIIDDDFGCFIRAELHNHLHLNVLKNKIEPLLPDRFLDHGPHA